MSSQHIPTPQQWVAAWYAAPSRMLSPALSGRTLRQIVHVKAGGKQLRLRLSNRYGEESVTLATISVGHVLQGWTLREDPVSVTFNGQTSVTIEPGQEVVSDPVFMDVHAFNTLAITSFLAHGDTLTGHLTAQQTSYISGLGNAAATATDATSMAYPLMTGSWYLITGIDVVPSTPLGAVVAFGSSTTDGLGSTPNTNRRWTDYLAHRLQEAGETQYMSVINAGLSGNQLIGSELSQFANTGAPKFLMGEAGRERLAWDVLAQPGAMDLIMHIGSNDLRNGVESETLINALQQLAQQARKSCRRVFGTTILPGGYTPEQAEQRQLVNNWILAQGRQCFDAVFDFATPLKDQADDTMLDPEYDSGDGVHPNDEGYRLMAQAVDISKLSGSPIEGH